jgi:hypothetical protein
MDKQQFDKIARSVTSEEIGKYLETCQPKYYACFYSTITEDNEVKFFSSTFFEKNIKNNYEYSIPLPSYSAWNNSRTNEQSLNRIISPNADKIPAGCMVCNKTQSYFERNLKPWTYDLLTLYHILRYRELNGDLNNYVKNSPENRETKSKEIIRIILANYCTLLHNTKNKHRFFVYVYTNAFIFGIKCNKKKLKYSIAGKLILKIAKKIDKLT